MKDRVLDSIHNKTLDSLKKEDIKSLDDLDNSSIISLIKLVEEVQSKSIVEGMKNQEDIRIFRLGSFNIKKGRRTAVELHNKMKKEKGITSLDELNKQEREEFNDKHKEKLAKIFLKKKLYKKDREALSGNIVVNGNILSKSLKKLSKKT